MSLKGTMREIVDRNTRKKVVVEEAPTTRAQRPVVVTPPVKPARASIPELQALMPAPLVLPESLEEGEKLLREIVAAVQGVDAELARIRAEGAAYSLGGVVLRRQERETCRGKLVRVKARLVPDIQTLKGHLFKLRRDFREKDGRRVLNEARALLQRCVPHVPGALRDAIEDFEDLMVAEVDE